MNFFIPENDDLVDPHYDFENDTYGPGRNGTRTDVYAHEIYGQLSADGVLVSKSTVKPTKAKAIVEAGGIRKYLRLPEGTKVMGDCGAFQFINEETPPYTCEEICDYYESCGFDYGITLDHLITVFDVEYDEGQSLFTREPTEDMLFRYELTISNAKRMLELKQQRKLNFEPVGAVQGWSPLSYHMAIRDLIEAGYRYLAIGGMARASNSEIEPLLREIGPAIREADVKLHFLGVARTNVLDSFAEAGITTCDSASTILQAFKSNKENYHTPERTYCAVRIPPVMGDTSPKVHKLLKGIKHDPDALAKEMKRLHALETKALKSVRAYASGKTDLSAAMKDLVAYEDQFGDEKKYYPLFEETLRDRPWEQCECSICKDLGVEVVILRGNNRNRRRGFHNTWVFYQRFLEKIGR